MDVRTYARWLFEPKRDLHNLALGGAWLFAVGSLLPLLWLIWFSGGGLLQAGYVFDTVVDGRRFTMPLLAYSGWLGLMLLWTEVLAVSGATLFTAFPRRVPLRWQRLGHAVLVGWSALWVLGTWRLALVDWSFWFHALFITAFSACTIYRAWRGWNPPAERAQVEPPKPVIDSELGRDETPNFFATNQSQPPSETDSQWKLRNIWDRSKTFAMSMWRRGAIAFRSGLDASRDNKNAV